VQFFCSEEHLTQWKAQRPDEAGFALDFHQSARICFEFYGKLRGEFATSP
jgi:hypothetical protein